MVVKIAGESGVVASAENVVSEMNAKVVALCLVRWRSRVFEHKLI